MTINYIVPYRANSQAARALSRNIGIDRIEIPSLIRDLTRRNRQTYALINYGKWVGIDNMREIEVAATSRQHTVHWFNHPAHISSVSNKLKFFNAVEEYYDERGLEYSAIIPEFWTESEQNLVLEELQNDVTIVARTSLSDHSGRGIVLMQSENDFVQAELYTRYIPKMYEFRVHLCRDSVPDVQRKVGLRDGVLDWKIRSHVNGFVYSRDAVSDVPGDVITRVEIAARQVFDIFSLDFGAVDVIYNNRTSTAYVLEINTAPGLEGTTLANYSENFLQWLSQVD